MNRRMVLALAVTMLFLSSIAVTTPYITPTIADDETISSVNMNKLEPDLISQLQANPSGEYRVVVVLYDGYSKAGVLSLVQSLGGTVNSQHDLINAVSISIQGDKLPSLTSLRGLNKILLDEKKYLIPVPQSDDSGAALENFYNSYPYWYSQFPFWIGADNAWNMGINGAGVTVAILDTGIFYEHPELDGVVIDYKVFTSEADVFPHDGYGHGTACSGLVAAQGIVDWDLGVEPIYFKVLGVAPGAKIIGGKVLTDEGWGWDSWIMEGMEWAVKTGADIISCSFGGLEIPNDGNDPSSLTLDAAAREGVVSFVAAGNDQGFGTVGSPSCGEDVISVGASTENSFIYYWLGYWPTWYANGYENDQLIFWSSGGTSADGRVDPDICAVGAWGFTLDTYPYYLWLQFGGTSMATPIAAGVGALTIQAYRLAHGISPSPREVKNILMSTAKDLGYSANRQGAGRVDAYQAVLAAMSERCYSNKGAINTGIVEPGSHYSTKVSFTQNIDYSYATKLEYAGSATFEGLQAINPDSFVEFDIPNGVEYAQIALKFPVEYAYGVPVRQYDGSQWTDIHLNTALYRVEEDQSWTLINYAYAHTNVQWLDARVTPGHYVLWIWNAYPLTVEPVDVRVSFYKFVPWKWVTTYSFGDDLYVNVKVPNHASPGSYSGFVRVNCGGELISIPIAVTVPAKAGQSFAIKSSIMNEPRAYISGDWFYTPVEVNKFGFITLTVSWAQADADFDVYLIAPDGNVEALSQAPSVPITMPGGGGRYWYTVTGTTIEVLSTLCMQRGVWLVGIHSIYFGNAYDASLSVQLKYGTPINTPGLVNMKAGSQRSFTVTNNIGGNLAVSAMALSFETEHFAAEIEGTVYSFNYTYVGYDAWLVPVTPDILYLTASLQWAGSAELHLTLIDPAGASRGQVTEKGQTLTICDPAIGLWTALITIHEVGSEQYTVNLGGLRFQQFEGVTIQPGSFVLGPHGHQSLTISASQSSRGAGFIVFYDLYTGSIYSETLLSVTRGWHC